MYPPKLEQFSALQHHCGVCHTPFSSPSALSTCIGKHEVICASYHFMFFFVGKAHSCKACINTRQQQEKRHRAILTLLQEYRKENDGEGSSQVDLQLAPSNTVLHDGLKKKERKAQKKVAQYLANPGVIPQRRLDDLHELIYPENDNEDADKALADLLAMKSSPGLSKNRRMLDSLTASPKDKPDLTDECARVMAAQITKPPSTKKAQAIFDKIQTALKEDMEISWKTKLEMKKRRIVYAQWITQGAVDSTALNYEDWDIHTGARLTRRYKGDEQNVKSQDTATTSEDAPSEGCDDTEDSPTDAAGGKKWPNDKWRKGNNLRRPSRTKVRKTNGVQAWDDDQYVAEPRAPPMTLRILAQAAIASTTSPRASNQAGPTYTPAQSRTATPDRNRYAKPYSSFSSSGGPSSSTNASKPGSSLLPPRSGPASDGAARNVLASSRSLHEVVSAPSALSEEVSANDLDDDTLGPWVIVGKGGKAKPSRKN